MEKISDRLMAAMKATDTTYIELAQRTGISKSALQRYATGETEKIPLDRLEALGYQPRISLAGTKKIPPPKWTRGFGRQSAQTVPN